MFAFYFTKKIFCTKKYIFYKKIYFVQKKIFFTKKNISCGVGGVFKPPELATASLACNSIFWRNPGGANAPSDHVRSQPVAKRTEIDIDLKSSGYERYYP